MPEAVIFDKTKKIDQDVFLTGKVAFFQKIVFNNLLNDTELIFYRAQ